MERRAAVTGILICSILLVAVAGVGLLWPVLTCPNCKGAGEFVIYSSPTDTMGGLPVGRTGSKCTLCIGRRRVTLGPAIKYWITGRAPQFEPPYERYMLDDDRSNPADALKGR
jgi:hypothetical protein